MKISPLRHSLLTTTFLILGVSLVSSLHAEDWQRVESKDGKMAAQFPVDLRDDLKTQTDKTAAGKVTSYFGEYYGDGVLLAGSGADIPFLARAAGNKTIFDSTKKTFLTQAQGTETSSKETTVGGAPAMEVIYKGDAYQGKGDPYEARALLIIVNKRMYIINGVISKDTPENQAAAKKMFDSIEVSK